MVKPNLGRGLRAAVTRVLVGLALVLCLLSIASADDLRPIYIEVAESPGATPPEMMYRVRVRTPAQVMPGNEARLQLPPTCALRSGFGAQVSYRCGAALHGETVALVFSAGEVRNPAVIKFYLADGETHTMAHGARVRAWQMPAPEDVLSVAGQYTWLGTEHIFVGYDHLLFVLCLIWIAGSIKRVLITITGFTVAHSVTLALAALEVVRLPVPPIEAVIALSVMFLASEIVRGPGQTLTWRHPVIVSSTFGLLHGLGFAAVLAEIGLPQKEVITGLVFFNVGVELGQVAFALTVLAALALLRRWFGDEQRLRIVAGYAIGCTATFWFIERVVAFV